MEIKKSLNQMTDKEYLSKIFGEGDITTVPIDKVYKWLERNLEKYGNAFVNNITFERINLNKIKKDLKIKSMEITECPGVLQKDMEGKIIWVKF